MGCCIVKDKSDKQQGDFTDLAEAEKKQKPQDEHDSKPTNEGAKLKSYEAKQGSAPPPPDPIVEEHPPVVVEEAKVKLKGRSNIAESKVLQSKTNNKKEETRQIPESHFTPSTPPHQDEPKKVSALAAALDAIQTSPPKRQMGEWDEERIRAETREAKEKLVDEVKGMQKKGGLMGGFDEPAPPPPVEVIPVEEEAVVPLNDTQDTPAKVPLPDPTPDHFPSEDWFKTRRSKCPVAVTWWQDKTNLGIDITVPDATDVNCNVIEPNLFVFKCQGPGGIYELELDLLEPVVAKGLKVCQDSGIIKTTLLKKSHGLWRSQLIKSERNRYNELIWLTLDHSRTDDSDSDAESD